MARHSRVHDARTVILDEIRAGSFAPGQRLPAEERLAELAGSSRLTVREAVRGLAAENVLVTRQGSGTYVQPISAWTSVEAVLHVQRADGRQLLAQLLAVRGFIEVGAAELFADRVTEAELDELDRLLERMRDADAAEDLLAMAEADLAFHQVILDGCANPFISATLEPLSRALVDARQTTSTVPQIRTHAIDEHARIIAALRTGQRSAVRRAMRQHMRQTRQDAVDHDLSL
ncbi:MAG: FadR/GntR family transcriptional regulator [Actinomycetales bacterium]